MKRFFALVALVLGLASCQTEPEGLDVQMGGAVDATITVNIPDSETRAGSTNSAGSAFDNGIIANADYTVRYILQVFNEDGSASKDMMYKYSDDDTVAFDVRLVPGRDYRFVVWADIVNAAGVQDGVKCADLHYVIGQTLQNITLAEPVDGDDKWAAMDETRDAYTGIYDSVEFSASENITLTLKRPFAKLRVITTDMNELFGGVSPHNAVVTYTTPHYNAFNAFSGVASGERTRETHTYTIADYADQTGANKVLFTDYFFANESGVVKFSMDVKEADGQSIKDNNFNTDIAVKRNYLTTISGNILTDGNKVNVTIEDAFENVDDNGNTTNPDYDYETISSVAELLAAIDANSGEYIVTANLDVNEVTASTQAATRTTGTGTTINLNGYTITLKTNITIAEDKTLTITDINENGETGDIVNAGGKIVNDGTLNIEGGNFESNSTNDAPVIENNGTTNISGGVIGDNAVENTQNGDVNITGGTFESDPSEFVDSDYNVVEKEDGSFDVEIKDVIAKIGDVEYRTLQKAVNEAVNGDTITFIGNIEQVDGVIITDKNITIDLGGNTFTVTEGANTKNRNFMVDGSSVVTIKNGTMIAAGEYSSGAYGTLRTEGTANVTLNDVKLYNYRGNGFNVKVYTGTTVTINNSEIYSQYGGGVEAAGGTIELTNVKIEQKGIYSGAAWNSVAIGVNGGGNVTVKSGNYSASAISTDANAAQGTWVAYIMSSGGTLNINGGTFNGVVAETASAANACGLICADTKAIVNIYGGTFSSNGAILDMRNNTGGTPNPSATLYGGTFSADPRVSGLYASNLITVAKGYEVTETNGVWTVGLPEALAKFLADIAKGGEVTLDADITLFEPVVIESGKTIVLDLNGKTITGTFAKGAGAIIENNGILTLVGGTIKNTETNGDAVINNAGELVLDGVKINGAPIGETGYPNYAVYTSGTLVVENETEIISDRGVIYLKDGADVTINGGKFVVTNAIGTRTLTAHAIYAYGYSSKLTINGGHFEMNIANGGGTSVICPAGATIKVYGGNFYHVPVNDVQSGCFQNYMGYGAPVDVYRGTFNDDTVTKSGNIAEGSEATEADGIWTVRIIPVAQIGETEYETLEAAVAAAQAGNTITLLKDVTLAEELALPAGIIFNGNGKQINGKNITVEGNVTIKGDTKIQTLKSATGCTITIEDGKTLALTNFSFGSKDNATAEYEIKGGTVTANYGFFQHGKYVLRSNFETGYMYYSYGSDITVYGTFHSKGTGDGLDYVRGKLTIANGGKSIHDKSLWVGQPASWGEMHASMVIEEGGYVQANSLSVYEGSSLTYSNDADLKYNSVTGTEYITKN